MAAVPLSTPSQSPRKPRDIPDTTLASTVEGSNSTVYPIPESEEAQGHPGHVPCVPLWRALTPLSIQERDTYSPQVLIRTTGHALNQNMFRAENISTIADSPNLYPNNCTCILQQFSVCLCLVLLLLFMIFNIHGHVILIELTFLFLAAPMTDYTESMKRCSSLTSCHFGSSSGGFILINL